SASVGVLGGSEMDVFLTFHQTYEPVLGSIFLSALVAGLPLYALFVTLAVLRLPAWICAVTAMLTAALLGWIVWGMPLDVTIGSATEGMAFGLWPISWIVLNAVFFHNLTVASGYLDVIHRPHVHDHGPVGDGRTPAASVLDHHPRVSRRRPGRLAPDARGPAGSAGNRRVVRRRPGDRLQPGRPRAHRHHRRPGLDGMPGG